MSTPRGIAIVSGLCELSHDIGAVLAGLASFVRSLLRRDIYLNLQRTEQCYPSYAPCGLPVTLGLGVSTAKRSLKMEIDRRQPWEASDNDGRSLRLMWLGDAATSGCENLFGGHHLVRLTHDYFVLMASDRFLENQQDRGERIS